MTNRVLVAAAALLSIANLVLLMYLLEARRQVSAVAGQAAAMVQRLQSEPLAPFTANVSVDKTFSIPVDTSIPVKTTVTVPVTIPFIGQQVSVTVPIDTTVPIRTTISIPIKQTIPISISLKDLFAGEVPK